MAVDQTQLCRDFDEPNNEFSGSVKGGILFDRQFLQKDPITICPG
jgi:hypothetical protein